MKTVEQSVELEAYTVVAKRELKKAFLEVCSDPAFVIERAGRNCWKSEGSVFPGSAKGFIQRIKSKHHDSVLEHASATFRIITDRGILAEITRHRIASFSVESSRYCNYSKEKFGQEISVIVPPDLNVVQRAEWELAMSLAEQSYFLLLEEGCSPQIARSVLPMSLKTEIVMTMNFRSFINFLQQRLDKAAHPQIRQVAYMIFQQLFILCPEVFDDEKLHELAIGVVKDGLVSV